MQYFKLQIGCLILVLYVVFMYWKENKTFSVKPKFTIFDSLLVVGIINIIFDGATAYFVNHQELISRTLNLILHLFFFISIDAFIFLGFLYILSTTNGLPKNKKSQMLLVGSLILNIIIVIININSLEFRVGEITNYSMGFSVYTCFVMVAIYIMLSIITFFRRWSYIESHKRMCIFTYLAVLTCVTGYQMFHPQSLISSLAVPISILGIYLNQENPAIKRLSYYNSEMVMGFATLVENKDGSTGGHIKRTTIYVKLLAEELRKKGIYKNILTKDYINNLLLAAPMHDIGKIAIPDAILQKPGKLTDEEFEKMKEHTVCGGKIIQDTFGHLKDAQYQEMAYQVARYHHEKWNSRGYPEGLKEKEIPLCARIMAIADVFDAVSQNRCYREAMPLDKCFEIISEGRGRDFEPVLVDVFLEIRDKVEVAYRELV